MSRDDYTQLTTPAVKRTSGSTAKKTETRGNVYFAPIPIELLGGGCSNARARQLGEAFLTYIDIRRLCDWETGKILNWHDDKMAQKMGIPVYTLRRHRNKIEKLGFIKVRRSGRSHQGKQFHLEEVEVLNWVNPAKPLTFGDWKTIWREPPPESEGIQMCTPTEPGAIQICSTAIQMCTPPPLIDKSFQIEHTQMAAASQCVPCEVSVCAPPQEELGGEEKITFEELTEYLKPRKGIDPPALAWSVLEGRHKMTEYGAKIRRDFRQARRRASSVAGDPKEQLEIIIREKQAINAGDPEYGPEEMFADVLATVSRRGLQVDERTIDQALQRTQPAPVASPVGAAAG